MKQVQKRNFVYYSPEQIDYELNQTGHFPENVRGGLAKALAYLPKEIVVYVIQNRIFLSLGKKTRGEYWSFDDMLLKNKKGFILVNSSLWDEEPIRITFTIAHEVAHALKNHKITSYNDTDANGGKKRENEADTLATKWLKPHFKAEDLKKLKYKRWQLE